MRQIQHFWIILIDNSVIIPSFVGFEKDGLLAELQARTSRSCRFFAVFLPHTKQVSLKIDHGKSRYTVRNKMNIKFKKEHGMEQTNGNPAARSTTNSKKHHGGEEFSKKEQVAQEKNQGAI